VHKRIVNTTHIVNKLETMVENDVSVRPPNLLPCLTLTFDLLTPKVDRLMPLPTCTNVYQNRFIRFQHNVFTTLVKDKPDERTDRRTDGQTDSRKQLAEEAGKTNAHT